MLRVHPPPTPSVESHYNSVFSLTQTTVASTPLQIWTHQSTMGREQKAVHPRWTKRHNLSCWGTKGDSSVQLSIYILFHEGAGRAAESPRNEGAVIYCCNVTFRLTFLPLYKLHFRLSGQTPSGALAHIQMWLCNSWEFEIPVNMNSKCTFGDLQQGLECLRHLAVILVIFNISKGGYC